MFDSSSLEKRKNRFAKAVFKSLQKMITEIPPHLQKQTLTTVQLYQSSGSIAGLTHVFHFLSEYLYSSEILEFLYENRSSFSPVPKEEIHSHVQLQMEEDFSSEDFHLESWKALPKSLSAFRTFLLKWQNQSKKEFLKPQALLLPMDLKSSLRYSFQNPKDPKTSGWATPRFQKLPLDSDKKKFILSAESALKLVWNDGYNLYKTLTERVIPLSSPGLVSYSHKHQLGISYIHFQARDFVDHLDDLIHENSHHHLNLLLATEKLWKENLPDQIFFSPWRRALRPFRALVHSVFTFTYAAKLMEEILKQPLEVQTKAGFSGKDLQKIRFRFEEEVWSNSYSLEDLSLPRLKSNWTETGRDVLKTLRTENQRQKKFLKKLPPLASKSYSQKIKALKFELENARNHYLIR